ncbi:hypothetical protein Trydic_g13998 [Trypoxylus dichotomus]
MHRVKGEPAEKGQYLLFSRSKQEACEEQRRQRQPISRGHRVEPKPLHYGIATAFSAATIPSPMLLPPQSSVLIGTNYNV